MARSNAVPSGDQFPVLSERPAFLGFVTDAESDAVIRSALPDLAEARDAIRRGDLNDAIAYLDDNRSPDLLFVDISRMELPLSKVSQLSEVCEPGVRVVVIGDQSEIGLYRNLIHSGIADYIVKPLTVDLVRRAADLAMGNASEPAARKLGKIIAVMGTRGGVGTTTIAVNLAWHLANRVGRRVALIDLDLQASDTSLMLNLRASNSLREALDNPYRVDSLYLERVMLRHGEKLFVLTSEEPLSDELSFAPEGIEKLVSVLQSDFHYVVLDIPRAHTAVNTRAAELATLRVIVADETLRSLREVVRTRELFRQSQGQEGNSLLVLNRAGERLPGYIPTKEFLENVEMRPIASIPVISGSRGKPADYGGPAAAHRGPIANAVASVASEITGRSLAPTKWWKPWR